MAVAIGPAVNICCHRSNRLIGGCSRIERAACAVAATVMFMHTTTASALNPENNLRICVLPLSIRRNDKLRTNDPPTLIASMQTAHLNLCF